MATVVIPRVLTELESRVRGAGKRAATVAMAQTQAAIVGAPDFPVNFGLLRRSISVTDVEELPDKLVARIVVTGAASVYGVVIEFSRRPGARGPNWRHLGLAPGSATLAEGWRGSWVNRKLRAVVDQIAASLQAKRREAAGKKPRKTVPDTFRKQAVFLLARAIARNIHARGITARRFAGREEPNVAPRFRAAFALELRAAGVTGPGGGA